MAQALIWSDEALDDIDAIADYINRDSPYHAQRVVQAIFDLAESIPAHPKMGRAVPELQNDSIRERFLFSYRILYEIRPEKIQILSVIHGKRLLESIEDRFQ